MGAARVAVCGLLVVTGCLRPRGAVAPGNDAIATVAPPPASDSAAPPTPSSCATIAARQPLPADIWIEGPRCLPTPDGAWAFVPAEPAPTEPSGDFETDARIALAHVTTEGVVRRAPILVLSGFAATAARLVVHDWDGDGRPEAYVHSGYYHEGTGAERDGIFRYGQDGVSRYAPSASIAIGDVADVTNDGHPDLLVVPRFVGGKTCGAGFDSRIEGPTFLAHALEDGTFSLTDAEARAHAASSCPPHRDPFAGWPLPVSIEEAGRSIVAAVVCARVRGASETETLKRVHATYQRAACDTHGMAPRGPHLLSETDYPAVEAAARYAVPLRHPKP